MIFQNIGYYIVETISKPAYISLPCQKILSISSCICDMHPDLSGCFWQGHATEKAEYQKRLQSSDGEYAALTAEISDLFANRRIDVDSRFIVLQDACDIYSKYLCAIPDLRLIGITTLADYTAQLIQAALWGQNASLSEEPVGGQLIGGEILGFEYGGFHSYLCNSLEKDIAKKFDLLCDELGLIQNNYAQMQVFAESIAGLGEPVDWIPFLLYDYTPASDDVC